MDVLVWTIAHGDHEAQVSEQGDITGHPALVTLLQAKLTEPITVYRSGTVSGSDDGAIELQPGDGRYVAARIRTLCAGDNGFQITGCDWK